MIIWDNGEPKRLDDQKAGPLPNPQLDYRATPREHSVFPAGIKNDPVNSPSHYTDGGTETIDFIEAKKLNYNRGNAIKYISRAGKKYPDANPQTSAEIQDLEKAIWYLQREVKNLKG